MWHHITWLSLVQEINGLSPVQHQSITWANAVFMSNGPLQTIFSESKTARLVQESAFENVVCKMSDILFMPVCDLDFHRTSSPSINYCECQHSLNEIMYSLMYSSSYQFLGVTSLPSIQVPNQLPGGSSLRPILFAVQFINSLWPGDASA